MTDGSITVVTLASLPLTTKLLTNRGSDREALSRAASGGQSR